MADINGLNPGDAGYDPTSDPNAGTTDPGRSGGPITARNTGQQATNVPGSLGLSQPASRSNIPAPQAIAPFSGVNYPQFTPPPLPASLQSPYQLPTAQDLMANDPGYQARYQQGLDANQRSAAAQGTLLNGGEQKAISQYGQDYASGEYNNYVNQTLGQRQQQSQDYLNLAYGPAWQQNQAAVNQYGQLYGQYKDLVAANQTSQQNYIADLLAQQGLGLNATTAGAPAPISPGTVTP